MTAIKLAGQRRRIFRITRITGRVLLYLLLIVMSLWFLAPLFWMFMSSLMPLDQVGVFPVQWIPRVWQPENYTQALEFWNFGTTFRNTMFVAIVSLIGDIGSCTIVAYGFARFRFPFRDTLFLILSGNLDAAICRSLDTSLRRLRCHRLDRHFLSI